MIQLLTHGVFCERTAHFSPVGLVSVASRKAFDAQNTSEDQIPFYLLTIVLEDTALRIFDLEKLGQRTFSYT